MYSGFSGNCSHNFALIRILMVYHGLNISVMKSHAARSVNSVSSVNALCVYICDLLSLTLGWVHLDFYQVSMSLYLLNQY